jgi:hypothetical protein
MEARNSEQITAVLLHQTPSIDGPCNPWRWARSLRIVATRAWLHHTVSIALSHWLDGCLVRWQGPLHAPPTENLQACRLAYGICVGDQLSDLQTLAANGAPIARQASRLGRPVDRGNGASALLQLLREGLRDPGGPLGFTAERSQKTSLERRAAFVRQLRVTQVSRQHRGSERPRLAPEPSSVGEDRCATTTQSTT